MLELIDVDKGFSLEGTTTKILSGLNLQIEAGDFYAVLGPSGVGKSTLLSIMCGLDKPSAGDVRFNGQSIVTADSQQLVRLRNQAFGFVFQSPYHLNYRTVIENILLPSIYSQKYTRAQALERANYLIHYVGIEGLENRLPANLSGGELQRMVFARALLLEPKVIFADEPTGSLDKANSEKILTLLTEQSQQGCAVVMVTHDHHAASYATKVLNLYKVEEFDTENEIKILSDKAKQA